MKPQLRERSELSCVAECDPTPSSDALALGGGRLSAWGGTGIHQRMSSLLGVGFNSDEQVMSPCGLHNLCPH